MIRVRLSEIPESPRWQVIARNENLNDFKQLRVQRIMCIGIGCDGHVPVIWMWYRVRFSPKARSFPTKRATYATCSPAPTSESALTSGGDSTGLCLTTGAHNRRRETKTIMSAREESHRARAYALVVASSEDKPTNSTLVPG
jgi:hypothetical protein